MPDMTERVLFSQSHSPMRYSQEVTKTYCCGWPLTLPNECHSVTVLWSFWQKSEVWRDLFACPLISRGNSVLHIPSVNHFNFNFNQYLLHKLKEKLIEASCYIAGKENLFVICEKQHKNKLSAQTWR